MTKEQLRLLIEYIDAKISEYSARDTSDGGLIESMTANKIKDELYKIAVDNH